MYFLAEETRTDEADWAFSSKSQSSLKKEQVDCISPNSPGERSVLEDGHAILEGRRRRGLLGLIKAEGAYLADVVDVTR